MKFKKEYLNEAEERRAPALRWNAKKPSGPQPTAQDRLAVHLKTLQEHHKKLGEHIKNISALHKSGHTNWGHVGSAEQMGKDIEESHGFNDTTWERSD